MTWCARTASRFDDAVRADRAVVAKLAAMPRAARPVVFVLMKNYCAGAGRGPDIRPLRAGPDGGIIERKIVASDGPSQSGAAMAGVKP